MQASVESIAAEHRANKKGDGAVLLAWTMEYDTAARTHKAPQLVGLATLFNFASNQFVIWCRSAGWPPT